MISSPRTLGSCLTSEARAALLLAGVGRGGVVEGRGERRRQLFRLAGLEPGGRNPDARLRVEAVALARADGPAAFEQQFDGSDLLDEREPRRRGRSRRRQGFRVSPSASTSAARRSAYVRSARARSVFVDLFASSCAAVCWRRWPTQPEPSSCRPSTWLIVSESPTIGAVRRSGPSTLDSERITAQRGLAPCRAK